MSDKKAFKDNIKVNESVIKQTNIISKRNFYVLYFREKYLEYSKNEYNLLKQNFPNVNFSAELRIKSPGSTSNKYSSYINEGKDGNICDIFANTYIINFVNDSSDEKILTEMCFKFRDFLANSIPNTMNMPEKENNYIDHPKNSSYQAIHITREHLHVQGSNANIEHISQNNNSSEYSKFVSETQIKTRRMYINAQYGKARHNGTYKPRKCSLLNLPERFEYILDNNGYCTSIKEIPIERSFKEFFGIPYSTDYFLELTKE